MALPSLDEWIERRAVRDTVLRYARGVDRRNWELFRSCFCDEVDIDLSSWNGQPASTLPADTWVQGVRAGLSGFDATQHMGANHLIERDGDRARCTSDVQASHALDGERCTLGGWYDMGLIRMADGWKIRSSRLEITWRSGDESLFAQAAARYALGSDEA
ncbi:MAG: nuclear transport factor 2 family protein [Deltaproteobacteria bacterium]|nr:nuclear transport factor 2 family protein [Deltaproteobacteria bacterium]MBW2385210.1 nuclear transport factor 2 family protein [Deltaproteobacteria bacterium]MBW2696514.1 nuclear transport factor 2 family protein [Deltaproteobacteria bacterium]